MDELHRHLFTVLMDRDWKHGVTAAVDVTLLGRFYERFADHAVEIGRRVIFEATGEPPAMLTRCRASMLFTRDNHDPQFPNEHLHHGFVGAVGPGLNRR